MASRRTFSQFCSFKIRRTTLLDYIKFADLLILMLLNGERVRRDCFSPFSHEIESWYLLFIKTLFFSHRKSALNPWRFIFCSNLLRDFFSLLLFEDFAALTCCQMTRVCGNTLIGYEWQKKPLSKIESAIYFWPNTIEWTIHQFSGTAIREKPSKKMKASHKFKASPLSALNLLHHILWQRNL